jgi:hypothetical protein
MQILKNLTQGRIESETWSGIKKTYAILDDLLEQLDSG